MSRRGEAKTRFLVSGGTGFLGEWVVPLLREIGEVTCLSRSAPDCLVADLTQWDAGLKPEEIARHAGSFDVFLHMAGLYNLRVGQVDAFKQNVGATHTALTLAEKMRVPHFVHISTFAVSVREPHDLVLPDRIDSSHPFPDYYSLSKARAEELVRARRGDFKSKLILRLGALVGDSKKGRIHRIDGPYHCAEAMSELKGLIERFPGPLPLPGVTGRGVPVLPVDICADAIVRLCEVSRRKNWKGTRGYHLTPPKELTATELYRSTLRFLGLPDRGFTLLSEVPKPILKSASERLAHFPREELEYLLSSPRLDTTATERLFGENWCPRFRDYEDVFWKGYAEYVSNR